MSRFGIFKINDVEYDLDDLTLDEAEQIEEYAGAAFSDINYGSTKAMKAISYVLLRRTNAEVSWEEVGQVKLINFAPADEEMPELPPEVDAATETPPNDSVPGDSGHQLSAVSTGG